MSSASNPNPPFSTYWDVFLSFSGSDTRFTFTDHLHHALKQTSKTYIDDELNPGEVISDALREAIKNSRTYVVVISINYASSSWCLDELVEILEYHKSEKRLVIPIFHNIDPSDVRHQKGDFGKSFQKLQTWYENKMDSWCVALKQVAGISGHHLSTVKRSEADVIDKVVKQVLQERPPKTSNVAKYPVGLDFRADHIKPWLSSDTESVIKIGIYGMVGIGKTTLARYVYNQNYVFFDRSCFLADVGKVTKQNGLQILQKQLIDCVYHEVKPPIDNVAHGIEWIKGICLPKLFIVIDDIDSQDQFDSLVGPFGPGTVILVTTRNQGLLDTINVEQRFQYEVKILDKDESRELFTRHADPPDTVKEYIEEIMCNAGGLPMALVSYGSKLLKKNKEGWQNFLQNLRKNPDATVQQKLTAIYEPLDDEDHQLKDILLDIACFFVGEDKEDALKILRTYYESADSNIDLLKTRCFLTISTENKLAMHELVQAMAWKIARNDNDKRARPSRLWVSGDICNVLMKNKGTKHIEGIIPNDRLYNDRFCKVRLRAAEVFKKMDILRFLYLSDVELSGSFKDIFGKLRWFYWSECPLKCLPSDFCSENLVILELPRSRITRWKLKTDFSRLKILDASCSAELVTTPDFNRVPHLETLILNGCVKLERLDNSIGNLVGLVSLDLSNCRKIRVLPDNIIKLTALRILHIHGCDGLKVLPNGFTNLKSLTVFTANGLNLSEAEYPTERRHLISHFLRLFGRRGKT